MSADGSKLLFEGFLQKRKDTLKIMWVTYWFRLQNTTLFFYSKKNSSAAHLRGYYYIYTVQSVREVERAARHRFMFEIIMKNGKRKVLAAETAALRQEWLGHLWKAMNLSTSGVSNPGVTHLQVCEQQRDRMNSCTPACSNTDSEMELLPARPISAPPSSDHLHPEARRISPPVNQPEEANTEEANTEEANTEEDNIEEDNTEEAIYQNTLSVSNYHNPSDDPERCSEPDNAEDGQEGDYDVLPVRNKVCELSLSTENVYDFPQTYRNSAQDEDLTESVYDVPSSFMKKMPDDNTDEQLEGETNCMVAVEDSSSTCSSQNI